MEYSDFQVNASDLGNLCGCFGTSKQLKAIYKIWEKSTFKKTYQKKCCLIWIPAHQHIQNLKIVNTFQALHNQASTCKNVDDVNFFSDQAFDILFKNATILCLIQKMKLSLSPEHQLILHNCLEDKENCLSKLLFLQNLYLTHDVLFDEFSTLLRSFKLYQQFKKKCSQLYGTHAEKSTIQFFDSLHETKIIQRGHQYSSHFDMEHFSFSLNGCIDGICDDVLIEIKHRLKTFAKIIPLYEMMQIHAYLFLTKRNQATLLQCLSNTSQGLFVEQIPVIFDEKLWTQIIDYVTKCLQFIFELNDDTFKRDCFFEHSHTIQCKLFENFIKPLKI